jgi:HicA-like toxin of HicAB toxin-antitoxin system
VLSGASDANIRFTDLRNLLEALGFTLRMGRGDHHILFRPDIPEIINIQPRGAAAKPYQVKQVRGIIVRYRLASTNES